jgi:hypothetical protein
MGFNIAIDRKSLRKGTRDGMKWPRMLINIGYMNSRCNATKDILALGRFGGKIEDVYNLLRR